MRAGRGIAAWIVGWALAASAVAAPPMTIKFAEPVALPASAGHIEFDAYGRRFPLTLESNDRLVKAMPRKAGRKPPRVLRGKIDGVPGSWVRLTRVGNGLEGAIWDGKDIYVVTRYGSIARNLTTPLDVAPDQSVVYRLSDTLNGLPPEFCGLADELASSGQPDATGLQQYKRLVADLRANAATGVVASETLSIALIADQAFQYVHGNNSADMMMARLNVVDGIFTEQVGVILLATETRLVPANADPFTTTEAGQLLGQLSTYRRNDPAVSAAGLAHLMTGKNLDGNVLGMAFVDALCDIDTGVSLGDSEQGEFFSALVMAHELGHNFGAGHDGVPGACQSTPQTYLMSPTLNGSTQFSQCSLASMATAISAARGSCIVPASFVDLAVVMPPSPYSPTTNGSGFSLPITIRSQGSLPATNVRLEVSISPWFVPQGVTIDGANCTFAAPLLSCTLPDFAAGEERVLQMNVTGSPSGGVPIQAKVTANNDAVGRNDRGSVDILLQSGVDLAISVSTSAATVYENDAIDYTVDVTSTSRSTLPSQGGTARIYLGGIPIESFDAGPHACAVDPSVSDILRCDLADIAPGASTRITVRGRSDTSRLAYGSVDLFNLATDADPSNNYGSMTVNVIPERYVRLEVSTEELRTVIGSPYEVTFTLTATGRFASTNVRFLTANPWSGVIESVTTTGASCATNDGATTCDFGTLNPGDVRTVVVRFHMEQRVSTSLSGNARWTGASGDNWVYAQTTLYASAEIDVAVGGGGSYGPDEGEVGDRSFSVESIGVLAAQAVTVTVEVPLPVRMLALDFVRGPAGWTCELLTSQRGRCTGSFKEGTYLDTSATLKFTYVSDVAGEYLATLTADVSGDGDLTNNAEQNLIRVHPFVDVGISVIDGTADARPLVVGDTMTVNATITTGKNPVTGVRVERSVSYPPAVAVDSFVVSGFDCTQSVSTCELGDLPPNASILVTAVVRAVSPDALSALILDVSARLLDSDSGNDRRAVSFSTFGESDVRVSVAASSVTATLGTKFNLPRITITNGAATARDITVDIPLPPFATLLEVQGNAMCTGTTSLQCTLSVIAPNDSSSIDVTMNPNAAGTFSGNVGIHVFNDVTPDNNSVAFTVTANAAPPGGGSGGGGASTGGGGGGRFEWLALALLGAMALRRWGQTSRSEVRDFLPGRGQMCGALEETAAWGVPGLDNHRRITWS